MGLSQILSVTERSLYDCIWIIGYFNETNIKATNTVVSPQALVQSQTQIDNQIAKGTLRS